MIPRRNNVHIYDKKSKTEKKWNKIWRGEKKLKKVYYVQQKSIIFLHEEIQQVDRHEGKTWKWAGQQDRLVQADLPIWIKSEKFDNLEGWKRDINTRCRRERKILEWYLGLYSTVQWKWKMFERNGR